MAMFVEKDKASIAAARASKKTKAEQKFLEKKDQILSHLSLNSDIEASAKNKLVKNL